MPGKKAPAKAPAKATAAAATAPKKVAGKKAPAAAPKVAKAAGKVAKAPGGAKPAAAGKGKAAAPVVVKARGYVKRYPRLNKSTAAGIKEAQSKQRALAVAKLIAQGKQRKGAARVRTNIHFHRPRTLRLPKQPKFPASFSAGTTASHKSIYNVVKFPLQTESAMQKIEEQNTIVFIVDPRANKHQIKHAIEKMYDVKTAKINTLIRPDGAKKAFVRLAADQDALDVANRIGLL